MLTRVKVFTHLVGGGASVIEPKFEDQINQWLESVHGQIRHVTQSESDRGGNGHHVTVCVWYVPRTDDEGDHT